MFEHYSEVSVVAPFLRIGFLGKSYGRDRRLLRELLLILWLLSGCFLAVYCRYLFSLADVLSLA